VRPIARTGPRGGPLSRRAADLGRSTSTDR
jgi:hypothetical protein